MGVSFDEDSFAHSAKKQKKVPGLTQWLLTLKFARSEKEATQRLLVLAVVFFLLAFFFAFSSFSSVDTVKIDPTDPVLRDQTL